MSRAVVMLLSLFGCAENEMSSGTSDSPSELPQDIDDANDTDAERIDVSEQHLFWTLDADLVVQSGEVLPSGSTVVANVMRRDGQPSARADIPSACAYTIANSGIIADGAEPLSSVIAAWELALQPTPESQVECLTILPEPSYSQGLSSPRIILAILPNDPSLVQPLVWSGYSPNADLLTATALTRSENGDKLLTIGTFGSAEQYEELAPVPEWPLDDDTYLVRGVVTVPLNE